MPEQDLGPDARRRLIRTSWLAFVAAPFFLGLSLFFRFGSQGGGVVPASNLLPAAAVLALGLAVLSFWWRSRQNAIVDRDRIGVAESTITTLTHIHKQAIIAWAFSAAVAIVGMIVSILSWDLAVYLPFLAAALVLLAFHRPAAWSGW